MRGPSSRTPCASRRAAAIRDDIAAVVPGYEPIAGLRERGDQFQIGGPRLCEGPSFPLPGGRARFQRVTLPASDPDDGRLRLSTRRGKQFNSMVQSSRDALTGAARSDVLLSAADAQRLGLGDGER